MDHPREAIGPKPTTCDFIGRQKQLLRGIFQKGVQTPESLPLWIMLKGIKACINRLFYYCKGRNFKNSYLGVVWLFHLLNKGNQVLFIIW